MEHPEISNLEINPLIVFEQGKGACAVDARIIKKLET
jgi:succinyl-CoA synthetase beta subunit